MTEVALVRSYRILWRCWKFHWKQNRDMHIGAFGVNGHVLCQGEWSDLNLQCCNYIMETNKKKVLLSCTAQYIWCSLFLKKTRTVLNILKQAHIPATDLTKSAELTPSTSPSNSVFIRKSLYKWMVKILAVPERLRIWSRADFEKDTNI